jgi:multiple sugar transport system ATP-binding protein
MGEVTSNHWLGDSCHVGIMLRDCLLIAIAGRDLQAPVGSQVPVVIPAEAVHIFDAETGVAIQHGLESAVALAV